MNQKASTPTRRRVAISQWLIAILLLAGLFILPGANEGHAQTGPQTWFLEGVTFDTGATASGSFDYDAATNTYTNINIAITDPGGPGPIFTAEIPLFNSFPTEINAITDPNGDLTGRPIMFFKFASALTAAGGSVNLEIDTSQTLFCFNSNCTSSGGPFRSVISGRVTTVTPTPTPTKTLVPITSTPTETQVPVTPTPTEMLVPVTPTPTETLVPATPTNTPVPPTPTCGPLSSTGTTFEFSYADIPVNSVVQRSGTQIGIASGTGTFQDTPGGADGTTYTYGIFNANTLVANCGTATVVNPPGPTPTNTPVPPTPTPTPTETPVPPTPTNTPVPPTPTPTNTPFATCGGYDVFETSPGVYAAPSFAGNLIVGTNGKDVLVGTSGPDLIVGLNMADDIKGKGGDDVLCGDKGSDIIAGGNGLDVLFGGPGKDILKGGRKADHLNGNGGADTLQGNRGADVLFGSGGNDDLFGNAGDDDMNGGRGNDACNGGSGTNTGVNCETATGVSGSDSTVTPTDDMLDDAQAIYALLAAREAADPDDAEAQIFLPLVTN